MEAAATAAATAGRKWNLHRKHRKANRIGVRHAVVEFPEDRQPGIALIAVSIAAICSGSRPQHVRRNEQLIEHTKRQIRSLVQEIAQLSKQNLAREQYFGEFLPRVVAALAAIGGAVWTKNNDGQLFLQFQINLQQTNLREENEENQARHGRLLYKALESDQGMLVLA